jgi:hypothetical protein
VEHLQQCRISFEPPKPKRTIAQCANCQRYGHTKNYCNLQSRCVKCADAHSTHLCPRKDRSKDVKCVLCGGNHPANYKGCQVYKELQLKTYPPLRPKPYLPPAPIARTSHSTPGMSYAQAAAHSTPPLPPSSPASQPSSPISPPSDIQDLKQMVKQLCDQMGSLLNLLTSVLTKLH